MHRIVIVGGGFSGTALAIQLLRQRYREYTRIVLVDAGRPGRGVAYRADAQDLLLNVRAGSMGVCEEDPGGFVTYARTLGLLAEPSDFLPRSLFGAYVEAELARHVARAPKDVRFAFVRGEAIELEQRTDGPGFRLWLADGRSLHAHAVIVATGNPPPTRLASANGLDTHDGYVADPWLDPLPPIAGRVLLIGTGLTMIDTALRLGGNGGTRFVAISRRGLLPRVHAGAVPPWSPVDPEALRSATGPVRTLLRFIRTSVREQVADPQAVVRTLRAIAPHIWRRWSRAERARFLRHVRIYWDVHRHLQPLAVARRIDALRSEGGLQLQAARLLDLRPGRHGLVATLRDRVTGHAVEHEFDWS